MFMKKHSVNTCYCMPCFHNVRTVVCPNSYTTYIWVRETEQGVAGQPGEKTQRPVDISKDKQVSGYLHKKLISTATNMGEYEVVSKLEKSCAHMKSGVIQPLCFPDISMYWETYGAVFFQGSGWVDICLISDEGSSRKVAVCHVTTQEIQEIASRMIGIKATINLGVCCRLFAFLAMVVTLTALWQAVHSGLFIESATRAASHALSPEFSKTLKDAVCTRGATNDTAGQSSVEAAILLPIF